MKNYLLSLLIVGLSFIGFSNAGNLSISWNGTSYNPSTIIAPSEITSYDVVSECENGGCDFYIEDSDTTNACYGIHCFNNSCSVNLDYFCEEGKVYNLTKGGSDSGIDVILTFPGGGTGGDDNTGGLIINGGTSQLSPVVSAIYSVMLQFIPYVVYIGIGILLCTLGFYAIKWLVNWLTSKITNYFK